MRCDCSLFHIHNLEVMFAACARLSFVPLTESPLSDEITEVVLRWISSSWGIVTDDICGKIHNHPSNRLSSKSGRRCSQFLGQFDHAPVLSEAINFAATLFQESFGRSGTFNDWNWEFGGNELDYGASKALWVESGESKGLWPSTKPAEAPRKPSESLILNQLLISRWIAWIRQSCQSNNRKSWRTVATYGSHWNGRPPVVFSNSRPSVIRCRCLFAAVGSIGVVVEWYVNSLRICISNDQRQRIEISPIRIKRSLSLVTFQQSNDWWWLESHHSKTESLVEATLKSMLLQTGNARRGSHRSFWRIFSKWRLLQVFPTANTQRNRDNTCSLLCDLPTDGNNDERTSCFA